jgi:hypothetical protein
MLLPRQLHPLAGGPQYAIDRAHCLLQGGDPLDELRPRPARVLDAWLADVGYSGKKPSVLHIRLSAAEVLVGIAQITSD